MIYNCGFTYIDLDLLEVVSDISCPLGEYFFEYQINGVKYQSLFYDAEVDIEGERNALVRAWKAHNET